MGSDEDEQLERQYDELSRPNQRLSLDKPTETQTETPEPPTILSKPKIVVLGASGKIGRLVVRHLLEMSNLDATIVAFCRDYDKACRVLYDDMVVAKSQRKGPKLQIVQGDLVPPEDLPRHNDKKRNNNNSNEFNEEDDDDERQQWLVRAKSAATFYGNKIEYYDNRIKNDTTTSSQHYRDEALSEAIRGCTVIISCIGSVRRTNIWTDYIERPLWRLFRHDVSDWCTDSKHPYYVHYKSTKKALRLAEIEQLRREADLKELLVEGSTIPKTVDRIRFIRVSDLVCSQQPWHFIPLVTNIVHSMVFRYQHMAEQALRSSTIIDTITIRPGDLIDEIREEDTTSLEIVNSCDPIGFPSRIGRDDVAGIVVAAALYDFHNADGEGLPSRIVARNEKKTKHFCTFNPKQNTFLQRGEAFHYTLACRWLCENMDPYPAQGKQSDGYVNADACLNAIFRKDDKNNNNKIPRRQHFDDPESSTSAVFLQQQSNKRALHQKPIKPYGIYVAFTVYLFLALLIRNSVWNLTYLFTKKECISIGARSVLFLPSVLTFSWLTSFWNVVTSIIKRLFLPSSSVPTKYIRF